MTIIKSRAVYFIIPAIIIALPHLIFFIFPEVSVLIRIFAVIFGGLAAAYWCIYYHSIKYELSGNNLISKSGIIIKKTRKTELSSIVSKTTAGIGKSVFISVLHTPYGSIIIFGKLENDDDPDCIKSKYTGS